MKLAERNSITNFENFTGKILIATPNTNPRSYFARTIIYIVEYNKESGTIGLIVNQPLAHRDSEEATKFNVDKLTLNDIQTYTGGPIEIDRGFLLHSDQKSSNESIYLNSNIRTLKNITNGKGPKHSMLLFGYCGWEYGQLEREIINNEWLILAEDKQLIFEGDNIEKWSKALQKLNIDPARYINKTIHC